MIFQEKARVISNFEIGDDYFEMALVAPKIAKEALPGQFVMVRCSEGLFPFLRRPFSIAGKDSKRIKLLYKVVGIGTEMLSQIPSPSFGCPEEFLNIMGPLGNGFNLDVQGNILLAAGGIGIAPLLFLIQELVSLNPKNRKRIWLLFGEKTSEFIDYVGNNFAIVKDYLLPEHLEVITEDGSAVKKITEDGFIIEKGLTTDLLLEKMIYYPFKFNQVYACGPNKMLEKVAKIVPGRIPCWVSVESRMACGLGACRGCVIPTIHGYKRVCKDGPIFEAREVKWNEIV